MKERKKSYQSKITTINHIFHLKHLKVTYSSCSNRYAHSLHAQQKHIIPYLENPIRTSTTAAAGPIRLDGRLPPLLPPSSPVKSVAGQHGRVAKGSQTVGMVTVVETEGKRGRALDQTVQTPPVTRLEQRVASEEFVCRGGGWQPITA